MRKPFIVAVSLAVLAASTGAQQEREPAEKSDPTPTEQAAQNQQAMELFFGFTRQMMEMSVESQQREARRKAEQEERARQAVAKAEADANAAKLRPFEGVADLFLDPAEVAADKPSVSGVRLIGYVELGESLFAEFSDADGREPWVIDTARLAAVRVRKSGAGPSTRN